MVSAGCGSRPGGAFSIEQAVIGPGFWIKSKIVGKSKKASDIIHSCLWPKKNSLDILGIKPVAEALKTVTKGAVDGASAFLSRICLPAAEEFGLLLKDRVHHWRAANLISITQIAERKMAASGATVGVHAHPRLVSSIIEQGTWIDDGEVQEMWSGLLVSSCTESGNDESNLLFVNLLSRLTTLQAKLLNYACKNIMKGCSVNGLIHTVGTLEVTMAQLSSIAEEPDLQRLDRSWIFCAPSIFPRGRL